MALDTLAARQRQVEAAEQLRVARVHVGPAGHLAGGDGQRVGERPSEVAQRKAPGLVGGPALRVRTDHPVELHGRARERIGDGREGAPPAELPELQRVGEERGGPQRQHVAREGGGRDDVGGVHVRVDVAGHEDAPARLQHARARADHVVARADVGNALTADGDVRRVHLARVDVEQRAAAKVEIGGRGAARDRGEAPSLGEPHFFLRVDARR